MYILLAIFIFGLLIFIHELGHFLAARICGVHVLEFAIGMGPKLFSITSKKTGTVYSIRLLPLGGYVSMLGENGMEAVQGSNGETNILINTEEPEESPEGDDEKALLGGKEEVSAEDEKEPAEPDMRSYSNQSVWRRMFISLAGPFMNVVLGFLLMLVFVVTTAINNPLGTNQVAAFFVEYSAEESYEGLQEGDYIHKVDGTLLQSYAQLERSVAESESKLFSLEVRRVVTEGEEKRVENVILTDVYLDETILKEQFVYSSSERTGLQVNDTVVKVNSTSVHTQNELAYEIMNQGWQDMNLTVIRNGEEIVLEGVQVPRFEDSGAAFGDVDFQVWAEKPAKEGGTMPSIGVLLKHSWFRSVSTIKMVYDSLVGLFTQRFGVEAVSGPVGITQTISTVAKTGFLNVLYLVVVISINLGIMNLLPIPGLDGGHLLIYIIEAIRRKPMKKELEGMINFIGLILLLTLAVLIAVKDIINL